MADHPNFDQYLRVGVIYGLAILGATAHMLGEFLREAAVLLMVFVPLELWKPANGIFNSISVWHVAEGSVFLLFLGMVLEFISLFAHRIKRDLEVSNAS